MLNVALLSSVYSDVTTDCFFASNKSPTKPEYASEYSDGNCSTFANLTSSLGIEACILSNSENEKELPTFSPSFSFRPRFNDKS